jgi:hypothetical protein
MKRLLAILMFATSALAADKWWESYNKGVAAVNGGSFQLAATHLQKAIAEQPTESTSIRAGKSLITYVPHFYLGIAKFNLGDTDGALRFLRALPYANGKVGIIGYCSGGRQAYLAACRLPLDAAVDCYGAFVAAAPPAGMPLRVEPVIGLTGSLSCPLLGLFGAEDQHPSPAETAQIEDALTAQQKTYAFHTYEGAGHGFFATDRVSYRPEAAADGWQRIWAWFERYLGA